MQATGGGRPLESGIPTMPFDAERIRAAGHLVVLAVDQEPFDVKGTGGRWNTFCVLQPLVSVQGDVVEDATFDFPNRGRVWWLVRDEHPATHMKPGTLWCGRIERAPQYDEHDPESDKYQVHGYDMKPASAEVVEIVDLDVARPFVEDLLSGVHFRERPPTASRILVRGRETTLGPFAATPASDGRGMELGPVKAGDAVVFEIPSHELPGLVPVHSFTVTVNQYDRRNKVEDLHIALTLDQLIPYDRLRRDGYVRDAATDAQVLNYCLNKLGFTRGERTDFKRLLVKAREGHGQLAGETDKSRVERFQRLIADGERLLEAGEAAAKAAADALPELQRLVERHAEVMVADRVDTLAGERTAEIEAKIGQEKKRLDKLRADVARVQKEYEERVAKMDEDLRAAQAERIKALEEREKELEERAKDVERKEAGIRKRLERVIALYQEEGDRVVDELLAQLPLLGATGLAGKREGRSATGGSASGTAPAVLPRPAWLERKRNTEALTEKDFLDQLRAVVAHRGFVFQDEDLLNFHTCVKTGGLTVLAGPSGRGKSSLPRLYAEALGCPDELLMIPVRSDWLDDRDLVGAYNALSGRFEPAPCGLVDRLIAAGLDEAEERGGIFLVCLDEMNLARVEHYFASFLSVLEAPADRRFVRLCAGGLQKADDPYAPYRHLRIPGNVRIVGTVNIDETTHFFSPKVLDRSNVVSLAAPSLGAAPPPERAEEAIGGLTEVSLGAFASWIRSPEEAKEVPAFVAKLDAILAESRVSLGYRVLRRIQAYVASAKPYLGTEKALDFQVIQSVLPKVRRSAPNFPSTLKRLREELPAERFPRSAALLERLGESGVEDDLLQLL